MLEYSMMVIIQIKVLNGEMSQNGRLLFHLMNQNFHKLILGIGLRKFKMKKIICCFLGFCVLAGFLLAQNTTQLALSDADRAEYWEVLYKLSTTNCENEKDRTKFNATMVKLS